MTLPICLRPILQSILNLYFSIYLSVGQDVLFIVKISHLNQKAIMKDLPIILALVEKLRALILEVEFRIEELSKSVAHASLPFFQRG